VGFYALTVASTGFSSNDHFFAISTSNCFTNPGFAGRIGISSINIGDTEVKTAFDNGDSIILGATLDGYAPKPNP
jgi:hypothetical protein